LPFRKLAIRFEQILPLIVATLNQGLREERFEAVMRGNELRAGLGSDDFGEDQGNVVGGRTFAPGGNFVQDSAFHFAQWQA